jgi:hypothetical protein
MQDMLVEVWASSPLVGVGSLKVHAQLGVRPRFFQSSASALAEAGSRLRWVPQAGVWGSLGGSVPLGPVHPRSALDSSRRGCGVVPGAQAEALQQQCRPCVPGTGVLRCRALLVTCLVTPGCWEGRRIGP